MVWTNEKSNLTTLNKIQWAFLRFGNNFESFSMISSITAIHSLPGWMRVNDQFERATRDSLGTML